MTQDMALKLEPHFFAAFGASEAAIAVLDMLPDSDLVEQLKNLIYIQFDLFIHMIEGKHYGTNNLQDFMEYTQETKSEMRRLKDAS